VKTVTHGGWTVCQASPQPGYSSGVSGTRTPTRQQPKPTSQEASQTSRTGAHSSILWSTD